jgi:hypothetical protein
VRGAGEYIGSPLYAVFPEHIIAIFAVALLPLLALLVRFFAGRGVERAVSIRTRYRALAPTLRLTFWLLAVAGTIHLAVVFSHEPGPYTIGYAALGFAELEAARRLLSGKTWRLWTGVVLAGSILAYSVDGMAGSPPDQLGLATKLVELTALAVVLTPARPGRARRLASAGAVTLTALVIAVGAWAGAFSSGDGGHHLGEFATPGTLIPSGEDRPPTASEQRAADELYAATVAATSKYSDPAVAAAAGYQVDGIFGTDFHAPNPRFQNDGRIFDPARPETLIYAATTGGPALIGVMYESEGIGNAGPAIGGPLTVWHAHDHICVGLLPPSPAGITSPFGLCPAATITLPITSEMIHVWTMPGAPERFGHVDDGWLHDYLDGFARTASPETAP